MKRYRSIDLCVVMLFLICIGVMSVPTPAIGVSIDIYPGLDESFVTDFTSNSEVVDWVEGLCEGCDPSSLFKYDMDGGVESGSFWSSYTYVPAADDDTQGGVLSLDDGGTPINTADAGCLYLVVKDGTGLDDIIDSAYAFNLLNLYGFDSYTEESPYVWDGMDSLILSDFWTAGTGQGAISHMELIGCIDGSSPPQGEVPEPATMLLLGTGLIGLAGVGRKKLMK